MIDILVLIDFWCEFVCIMSISGGVIMHVFRDLLVLCEIVWHEMFGVCEYKEVMYVVPTNEF